MDLRFEGPVGRYVQGLKPWIQSTAAHFSSFFGSMHIVFDEARLTSFLLQFQSEREVQLVKMCLDHIKKSYWRVYDLERALIRELRPMIEEEAKGRHVIYAPFGHLEDSSALLYAGAFKGHNLDVRHLHEFLTDSHGGRVDGREPRNTIICWLDDNVATGTQAPSIIGQYFGAKTAQEERHTRPLHTELQTELQKYYVVFAAFYAQPDGVRKINAAAAEVGLHLHALEPTRSSIAIHYFEASSEPQDRKELTNLLQKYGAPLFADKVGWSEKKRQQWALGYGGLGQLFLFCYQTPTSLPAMFWRFGKVNDAFWMPLFWRESNYERFARRLRLTDLHEHPGGAWDEYHFFVTAHSTVEKRYNLSLHIDDINDFYDYLQSDLVSEPSLFGSEDVVVQGELKAARDVKYFEDRLTNFLRRRKLI